MVHSFLFQTGIMELFVREYVGITVEVLAGFVYKSACAQSNENVSNTVSA